MALKLSKDINHLTIRKLGERGGEIGRTSSRKDQAHITNASFSETRQEFVCLSNRVLNDGHGQPNDILSLKTNPVSACIVESEFGDPLEEDCLHIAL
ncbi:hypothetical protein TNCV_5063761 [Trichonephila clavipes]|nr:hypothetical protein TNCV_5063761 [Trichonephila clavipes]